MKLIINGETYEPTTEVATIADLLTSLSLDEKIVIVEHNEAVLEKAKHAEAALADGDKIEIVHFVGGG